ncbi:MAG: leucine-rich repeat protein [Bacteroidaceae bacterium]|nr:leucine-rich repeat protein [Bacteroidaceae bacterium]
MIEADFGENLQYIGDGAFYKASNLSRINIGKSLIRIYSDAFAYCSNLQYIVIPSSIREIFIWDDVSYYNAFLGCSQLTIINLSYLPTGLPAQTINPSSFFTFDNSITDYNGSVPEVNYLFNGIGFGFQPTEVNMDDLLATAGKHTVDLHCTFANDFMSFNANIPYTYTINPAKLTAKVKDASRLYGESNPQFGSEYSGFVNNEDASVLTSNGSYTTTATAKSEVGTYPIKQTGATAQNYVFDYEDGTLTVNKAPLTMTANDKTMTYGGKVPTLDATYEGLKNNETVPAWTTEPTLTTTATPTSRVAQYPITISNAVAKNYDLTIHNGTLTIEKAPLTAKVDNKSRLYGDANPEFTLTYTGLKNNETVPEWDQQPSFETAATTQSNVGSYPVNLKNAVAVNYDITPVEGTLTVNKAPLKVMPKDATRKYGEENPPFELLYEGLKNSENQPDWTVEPIITTNATKGSSVGEYTIQMKSAEARNYTIEKGSGKLTVTKAPLTVKLMDATRKYGTANPNFEMSYTGLVNDETTPAWTTYPTVTTTAGEKSDVGDYPITATGGELKNYASDGIAPGVLSVTPASLVIRAQDASKYYFEENPHLDYFCTGFAQGDGISSFTTKPQLTTTATLQSPAGVYPIEVGGAEIKNYQLSYVKGQLTVDKRTLTVFTNDYTRVYGEENPEFELHYKGFVNNEDENVLVSKPKATTIANKNTDTGVYDITIGNGVAENYAFTYVGGKLTIEKAYQTLTWEQDFSDAKQYDQVELMAEASSGLAVTYSIEGDNIGSITKIGTKQYLDCSGAGEAVVVAQQEGNKNYWQTTKMYKPIKIVPTAVQDLENQANHVESIYDASGRKLSKLQRGVNVVVMNDGTKKKVVVK